MGVAGSCTAGLWEESEWDRGRHRRRNSQVGTATCLPAGRAEPTMATQPLSRTLKPAVPGGHAIWSARVLASTGRCVTRQPGTRPTSPTSPTGPTQHVASKSPRGGWQRHPDVRWSESRATSNECERTTKPRSGESVSARLIRGERSEARATLSACEGDSIATKWRGGCLRTPRRGTGAEPRLSPPMLRSLIRPARASGPSSLVALLQDYAVTGSAVGTTAPPGGLARLEHDAAARSRLAWTRDHGPWTMDRQRR
jgi:hypothetical protein